MTTTKQNDSVTWNVYQDSPKLGTIKIGTVKTVKDKTQEQVLEYARKRINKNAIVVRQEGEQKKKEKVLRRGRDNGMELD